MKRILIALLLSIIFAPAQHIHILVDSMCTYSLWTQMQEVIAYCSVVDGIQIVTRNFAHTGLNVNQFPGDLSFSITDFTANSTARYPTSIASVKPYISYPFLISLNWGGMGAQWESGGWFSSLWDSPVDIGPGDVNVHKVIGKELADGNILFIGVTITDSIVYRTWDSTLTNQIASGVIASAAYYWGFDVNGGIAYIFYYANTNDTLIYYKTTTNGINWSSEQTWSLAFTPPYPNTTISFRQMALTDNGEPRLVFDAIDGDDNEYPWYGKIYVSYTSGVPPVQVSSTFGAPDTECFYPTIATGGNYVAVLYCMPRNNLPDTLNWWDLYLVWSNDNGLTWASPINCTQSATSRPGLPQLAKRIDTLRNRGYYAYCALILSNIDPFAAILYASNDCPARLYLGCSPYVEIGENALRSTPEAIQLKVCPNPFSTLTRISVGKEQNAESKGTNTLSPVPLAPSLKIYDASGRVVRQWDYQTIGLSDKVSWSGTDDSGRKLPFGIYFIQLQADGYNETKKVILLK